MRRRLSMAVLVAPVILFSVTSAPIVQAHTGEQSSSNSVRWNYTTSLPVGSEYLAASTAPCPNHLKQSCVYALGGTNGRITNLKQSEAFDPGTKTWKAFAKLPLSDPDLAAASAPCNHNTSRTCVYVMGGAASRRVEMYDPGSNRWRAVSQLHVAREDLGATSGPCRSAIEQTCIYAVSGGTGVSNVLVASVEMYDPVHNSWKYVAKIHTARQFLGVADAPCWGAEKRACIYAVGGITGKGVPVSSAEMYDPSRNEWHHIAGLVSPTYSMGMATAPCTSSTNSACLYAIGGSAKPIPCGPATCYTAVNSVERYDPGRNRWTVVGSLNSPREHLAASTGPCPGATNRRCLYALSGDADPDGGDLTTVEIYGGRGLPNIRRQWTFVTSMETERAGLASATAPCTKDVTHDCVYAVGGTDQKGTTLASVEMFDPRQATWNAERPLPQRRLWAAAAAAPCELAVKKVCLYAIGGLDRSGNVLNTVQMYNPSLGTWAAVANLSVARFYAGATTAPCQTAPSRLCIYVAGGSDSSSLPLRSVEMFDPSLNTWTPVTSLPSARSALSVTTAPCVGKRAKLCLYGLGGYDTGANPLASVVMYQPAFNTWKAVRNMSKARYSQASAVGPCPTKTSAECLYAMGGIAANGNTLTSVEMYNLTSNTWSKAMSLYVPREQLAAATAPCHLQSQSTCLYAVGGTTGVQEDVLPTVETFEPGNK